MSYSVQHVLYMICFLKIGIAIIVYVIEVNVHDVVMVDVQDTRI
jgi:hypothetical protein